MLPVESLNISGYSRYPLSYCTNKKSPENLVDILSFFVVNFPFMDGDVHLASFS